MSALPTCACTRDVRFVPQADMLTATQPLGLAVFSSKPSGRNRRRTLRALADLDDRQLRDIGLTRNDTLYHALAGHEDAQPEYLRRKRKELHVD